MPIKEAHFLQAGGKLELPNPAEVNLNCNQMDIMVQGKGVELWLSLVVHSTREVCYLPPQIVTIACIYPVLSQWLAIDT